jgi:DcuC family C4-dicarboxylate transporter
MLFAVEIAAWQQWLGVAVVALAVWAIVRELEVRLVLLTAALLLGLLAFNPLVIIRELLATFTNERFVIPLCCGMGFAHVLRHTGCDHDLVRLLVGPLTHVRFLLIPGTVLVGFLVNMPIVSQSSTAVTIGAVIIPILSAARLSPVTIGAALLFGCSIGGELLNPAAPELLTTIEESRKAAARHPDLAPDPLEFNSERCVRRIVPLNLASLFAGTLVLWWVSLRHERHARSALVENDRPPDAGEPTIDVERNWLGLVLFFVRAAVPLLPLIFLYLCSYPFHWIEIEQSWLEPETADGRPSERFHTRLIGVAMLLGVFAAAVVTPTKLKGVAVAFCEGAGFGFAHIVSLIVVANCFGRGIREIGIADSIGSFIQAWPDVLMPAAGAMPLGFAALCGSGMATTQSMFGFFAEPSLKLGIDPTHTGAVVSIASAAGRTVSPVAAVTLMCARMTGAKPLDLVKQVALPVVISVAIVVAIAMIIAPAL